MYLFVMSFWEPTTNISNRLGKIKSVDLEVDSVNRPSPHYCHLAIPPQALRD